jgi:ABC-type transport system substrate-binding protein
MAPSRHTVRSVAAMAVGILAAVLLVACQAAPAAPTSVPKGAAAVSTSVPTAAQNATVTMLVPNLGNESFDPFTQLTNDNSNFMRFFAAPLVEGDGKGGMAPGIFTKWESNADATTWTFTVRQGVKAHNGTEITLDDVVWNLESRFGNVGKERVKAGEKVFAPILALAGITKRIAAVPPDKIVVELTAPKADLPFVWSANFPDVEGFVIPAEYFKSVGPDGFNNAPVGTGPLKLVSRIPGQEMVFERFEDYYYQPKYGLPEDRRPQFKTLVVRAVPEPATRISALQAGQADIISGNPQMVPEIKQAGGTVAYAQEAVFPPVTYIGCWDPAMWCYKKEVRQALEYAIDKQTLLDKLYGREAGSVLGWVTVTPSAVGYVPGVTDPFPYDPEKAKALLAQAGYPGGQGLPAINLRIRDNGLVPFLSEMSQVFVDSWKAIGVNAVIQPGDADTVYNTWINGGYLGDLIISPNTTRWLGTDYVSVVYTDPNRKNPSCLGTAPVCQPLTSVINEKAKVVYTDVQSMNKGVGEAYAVLRDANYQFTPFYLHQPWGLGPRVSEYKPWPLNAYPTAVWTIGVK